MKHHLASISGNGCLCVPDTNQYSKPLISALPSEPEQVIYHCCCSYLLVHGSLTLAFAACFKCLKSCYTGCGPYKWERFSLLSKETTRADNYRQKGYKDTAHV